MAGRELGQPQRPGGVIRFRRRTELGYLNGEHGDVGEPR
jgi:hypothetical protein